MRRILCIVLFLSILVLGSGPISQGPISGSGGGVETDPIVGAVTGIVEADGSGNISALANPTNCPANQAPLGIDASGAAEGCFAVQTPLTVGVDYVAPDAELTALAAGTINGVTIGATTPAAGTFTTFTIMSTTANTGGGYKIMYAEATSTLSGASTNIEINIPTGAEIIGTQLRTDTEITSGDGATSFSAAFSGGMTDAICSTQPFTKNNKVNSRTSGLVDSETDITITPNSGTFSGGVVRAVVYYSIFNALSDNP